MEVEATDLAPELLPPSQQVVFPGRTAALPFHTLVRTIKENETPLSSGQTPSINRMESERLDIAVLHRIFPFGAVRGRAEPVLVADDDTDTFRGSPVSRRSTSDARGQRGLLNRILARNVTWL